MNSIFVDFEMNPVSEQFKKERRISPEEIIEIGAVMLDDNNIEIDCYRSYIKPEYCEGICKNIQELTGITDYMLKDARTFKEVLEEFTAWCSKDKDYVIYAWSGNDLAQLKREIKLKQISRTKSVKSLKKNWKDFQKEYTHMLGLKDDIGLEKALASVGSTFRGHRHDALWDARNTADLFVLTKTSQFADRVQLWGEKRHENPDLVLSTPLGDLIDLNAVLTAFSSEIEEN